MDMECGCGGSVVITTCERARQHAGHHWVLFTVCIECRSVNWTREGCLDCHPRQEREDLPEISFTQQAYLVSGYAAGISLSEENAEFSSWLGTHGFGFIDGKTRTKSPAIERDHVRTYAALAGAIRDVLAMRGAWQSTVQASE